jgi:hypothetical protein
MITIKTTISMPINSVGSFGKTDANKLVINIAVLGLERFVKSPFQK